METRKLAVIMFTDMVGYSKKVGENEIGALQLLSEHNAILRPQIEAHGGNVIKTIGDAFMADFDSAANAVNCAAEIQRLLAQRNAVAEGEPIEVRVGIHVGDVIYREGDVFGDGVNIASRIEPLAGSGQIFVSRDVASITQGKVESPVKYVDAYELKNISRPVQVYEVLWDPNRAGEATAILQSVPKVKKASGKRPLVLGGLAAVLAIVLVLFGLKGDPPTASDKPRLAVIAFADLTGDDGLARVQMDKIVTDAVIQKFYEFPHTQLVSPLRLSKIQKDLDIGAKDLADDPEMRETVARETNSRLMIVGAVRKLGNTFRLSADFEDLKEGRLIGKVSLVASSPEEILNTLVDTLCNRFQDKMVAEFGIKKRAVQSELNVGELTTESLDAYSHFIKGHELYKGGKVLEGAQELVKATEIDTSFALAHSMAACAFSFVKTSETDSLMNIHSEKARLFQDRFADGISKEALIFKGNDAWYKFYEFEAQSDSAKFYSDKCGASYHLIMDLYPDDRDGYYYYGLYLHYLKQDYEGAIAQYQKAIDLSPAWYPTYRDLAYSVKEVDGTKAAIELLSKYIQQYDDGDEPGVDYARRTIVELSNEAG